jgi:hypothetical protein
VLTATGRWDGSSVLAAGHKWSFFPSTALAWRLEQEDFLKSVAWINQLKLRLGYGVTGNAAVGRYSTIEGISTGQYPYGSALSRYYFVNDFYASSTQKELANQLLGWERTGQYNLGFDFGFFKYRLSGTVELYASHTKDLLLSSAIPSLTGYVRTTANIGETRNRGVDITLNTVNIKAGDFQWETSINVSWQKNWIVSLSGGKQDEISTSPTGTRLIDKPINIYYDIVAAGIWKPEDKEEMDKFNSETGPDGKPRENRNNFKTGQIRPVDQNGDKLISTNDDRIYIGSRSPKWTGGITNIFTWKGIELMFQVYGRLGHWVDGNDVNLSAVYGQRKVDYYTDVHTNSKYPRPVYDYGNAQTDPYQFALAYSKASFVNIRNISLGYVFPKTMIGEWAGMQSLRVYAQCLNPGSIYQEINWRNMDTNSPIWNRSFVFGVSVGF